MSIRFYALGRYDTLLTADGWVRMIAAFHMPQGGARVLSNGIDMLQDILKPFMSPSAVSYWIGQGWLEDALVEKKADEQMVQLLRLTSKGIVTCRNSVSGGGNVPTTLALVGSWRAKMKLGGDSSFEAFEFPSLTAT